MQPITAQELRRLYVDFFVKRHGHTEIPGASLIPENDPTVLFTTAGMHPLVPFLLGEKHPSGRRPVDVQKCLRTDDVDEVGDRSHLTFFEMLGNWSLGDYFKKKAIEMSFEFLTLSRSEGGLGLPLDRLAVTCFEGDKDAPKDEESAGIWRGLGISADRLAFLPKKDNWWGPAGQTGPCGPDTEMFYWAGKNGRAGSAAAPAKFDPEDSNWIEIWNDVFLQYNKNADGTYSELKQKDVDTGMGFERVLAILNGVPTPFETELFADVVAALRALGGYDIGKAGPSPEMVISERIVCDHLRAATFLLGDVRGVVPSNVDQGYVLRKLIRRAVRHGRKLGISGDFARKIAGIFVDIYGSAYPELIDNQEKIFDEIAREEIQFAKTLEKGLKELGKCCDERITNGDFAFYMYETYGFPPEMTMEEVRKNPSLKKLLNVEKFRADFNKKLAEHQSQSRAGAKEKFSGGLADNSEQVTRLHTATHLLHQALKQVLGDHVAQKGSNITVERLRFDFTHEDRMTPEQISEVEKIVNEQIEADLPVSCEEMTVEEAKKKGAIGLFESKYGDKVKVYTVGSGDRESGDRGGGDRGGGDRESGDRGGGDRGGGDRGGGDRGGGDREFFSKEICGGPHVKRTGKLGKFKILKEESSSRGVRRIKAMLG